MIEIIYYAKETMIGRNEHVPIELKKKIIAGYCSFHIRMFANNGLALVESKTTRQSNS